MEVFGVYISAVVRAMDTPFTVFGFTFSFWNVWLWSCIMGILAWMIWRLFDDG